MVIHPLIMALMILMCSSCASVSPQASAQPPQILLLALDGIGFAQFKKMQEGGRFRSFKSASPMVATFPSISDPNWTKIMRTPLEPSFTKEHFDQNLASGKGEVRGNLIDHVVNPPSYEKVFDLKPEGALQHLASMTWSETTALYWLDSLEKRLFETRGKKVFTAFFANTDFIAHTKGEMAIFRFLAELDIKIDQLRKRYQQKFGSDLEVVLVSDHGNVFLKPQAVDVDSSLKKDGWNITGTLNKLQDVVYVVPEILSFAPFYVKKGQEEAIAKSVSQADGVHVAFYLKDNQVHFIADGGRHHSVGSIDKTRVSYSVLKGKDPLNQIGLFQSGSLPFSTYFQETLNHEFPNAIVRAWEGLTENTEQLPSVLVSTELGFVFSNKTLELITKLMGLESVHGSLHREESLGVFVSTHRSLPPVIPDRVMDFLN